MNLKPNGWNENKIWMQKDFF